MFPSNFTLLIFLFLSKRFFDGHVPRHPSSKNTHRKKKQQTRGRSQKDKLIKVIYCHCIKNMKLTKSYPLLSIALSGMLCSSSSAFSVLPHHTRTSFATSQLNMSSQKSLPIMGEESIMSQKAHGTSSKPVQKELRWNCDYDTADRICNFNRHYAEYAGNNLVFVMEHFVSSFQCTSQT